MTVAVIAEQRPPRVPYEMMHRVTAADLKAGWYLPLQQRLILAVVRDDDGTLIVTTRPLFRAAPVRTYRWPPATPVMMLPPPA